MPSGVSPTSFPSAPPPSPRYGPSPSAPRYGGAPAADRMANVGVRSARPVSSTGFRMRPFEPRGPRQRKYVELIAQKPLTFGLGAAGTGKTFLAVACALRALRTGECRKLVITRPVVEAGEKLGFLPGDLLAKLNPYMRPVYDALGDLLEFEDVMRLEEAGVIEVAPLAYMRGRTLANAFVILDEAQNCTAGQMKMFLTRLGENSRMVVTGDISQVDLPSGVTSGMADAMVTLEGVEGVTVITFTDADVVRHPLIMRIVRAYDARQKGAPLLPLVPPK